MERLAEENTKLKEVVKLMEKNIQWAQRKRDLPNLMFGIWNTKRGLYPSSW